VGNLGLADAVLEMARVAASGVELAHPLLTRDAVFVGFS